MAHARCAVARRVRDGGFCGDGDGDADSGG